MTAWARVRSKGKTITGSSFKLEVVEGPAVGTIELRRDESATIGRARECQICLPDLTVSRQHATVSSRGSRWFVRDLDSRHGTFLNAVRLSPQAAHPLIEHDLLRIGPWTFRIVSSHHNASCPVSVVESRDDLRIEAIPQQDVAQHRLNLILDASTRINSAASEADLGEAVIESVLAATNFQRAALIRQHGQSDQVDVLAHRAKSDTDSTATEFAFSRSLLHAAAAGQTVRLTSDQNSIRLGASIAQLGITDALCAPVLLGGTVTAYLYLDAGAQELPIHSDSADFCQAIARMCGLALANLKRIDLEMRQSALEQDIAAAREAQQFIVPASSGTLGSVEYALRMKPGSFVAGDLFDIFAIDQHRVGVFIGDVTGEGIGAAILMAFVQSHLHAALKRIGDPAVALNEVNAVVCARSASNRFLSMWAGVVDTKSGRVTYVDAGHGHWVLRRQKQAGASIDETPRPGGTLVGIDDTLLYANAETTIDSGDRIVLFSDGLLEQTNAQGEQFGIQRIRDIVCRSESCNDTIEQLFDAVTAHGCSHDLSDDATAASIALIDGA